MPTEDFQPGWEFIQLRQIDGHWTCRDGWKLVEETYRSVSGPADALSNMVERVPQHCESIATSGSDQ